jgi:flagellar hook-length control protein FliK
MMLPLMLQNSSANSSSPTRNATANAGREMQPSSTASFSKVLANEMNDKGDVPKTRPREASTVPDTAQNKIPTNSDIAAGDMKDTVVSASDVKDTSAGDVKNAVTNNVKDTADVKDLEAPENLENPRESKDQKALGDATPNAAETRKKRETKTSNDISATAIAASPQPMSLADILHGLIAAYSPNTRPDIRTETRTTASAETPETPTDIRAVDARVDAQTELATATDPQVSLTVIPLMLPGLAAARPGKSESGTSAATTAITASDLTPQSPGVRAAAATQPREKHAAGIQDVQNQKAIKLELDARQGASQQVEFSVPGISVAAQTGKSEKSLPELAPKDLQTNLQTPGLFNAPAAPSGVAADRGIAPAAAGMPVYAGLSLEPRLGATGWDNALGQKVLWMVSQQQQVAELSLNPPDLGPLQVVLTINNDQASATFVSQHADVRQALEAALPRLREMMAESGISLGSTTVSADTSQQHGGFERQDRSIPRHGESENGRAMAGSNAQSTGIGMSRIRDGGSRLVDTFA